MNGRGPRRPLPRYTLPHYSRIEVSAEIRNMRSGCVQDTDAIIMELSPRAVDTACSPLESDAAVANDDVAKGRSDLSKRHSVAGPECPGLS